MTVQAQIDALGFRRRHMANTVSQDLPCTHLDKLDLVIDL